jgi:threonine/homoserine/homoserine lactone efflux protein
LASGMLEPLLNGNPNLSLTERAIYIVGGLALAAAGARPRPNPLLNVLALAGGAYLAWCGSQGRCSAKALLSDAYQHSTPQLR